PLVAIAHSREFLPRVPSPAARTIGLHRRRSQHPAPTATFRTHAPSLRPPASVPLPSRAAALADAPAFSPDRHGAAGSPANQTLIARSRKSLVHPLQLAAPAYRLPHLRPRAARTPQLGRASGAT